MFLDEIGSLKLGLQAKMLRALQTGEITAVGDDQQRKVDIRVVAATNQPLEILVSQGRFREDLYHRLNVIRMRVLPLRERKEDIAPLASHFFNLYRAMAPYVSGIADEFVDALTQSGLPGNVRQIENLVRWALANKQGEGTLGVDDFPPEMWDELAQKCPARKPPLQALSLDSQSKLPPLFSRVTAAGSPRPWANANA